MCVRSSKLVWSMPNWFNFASVASNWFHFASVASNQFDEASIASNQFDEKSNQFREVMKLFLSN